jgi:hypothetical protein
VYFTNTPPSHLDIDGYDRLTGAVHERINLRANKELQSDHVCSVAVILVHRDLTSQNTAVCPKKTVKSCYFGISPYLIADVFRSNFYSRNTSVDGSRTCPGMSLHRNNGDLISWHHSLWIVLSTSSVFPVINTCIDCK